MLTDESKLEAFRNEREVDFSYSIPGVARFRVNAFVQRGSVSLVCARSCSRSRQWTSCCCRR